MGVVRFVANGTGGGGGGGGSEPSGSRSTVSADPESIQAGIGTSTITVTVLNGSGAPVEGATVTLAASGSGNTLAQPGSQTGADGVATGTLRSTVPGTKVVRATVNGNVQINQTAEVTVLVAAATQVELLEGDNQTAQVGQAVDVRPAVRVTNSLGQPVPGFGVTFVVTEGNGDVSGATQSTNSDGVARVGSWTLGAEGTNTLEARAGSLQGSPVVFTANGVPAPDHLVFLVQPSDVVEDTPFSPVVTVAIVDGAGNVVDVDGVTIDVDLIKRDGHESNELEGDTFQDDRRRHCRVPGPPGGQARGGLQPARHLARSSRPWSGVQQLLRRGRRLTNRVRALILAVVGGVAVSCGGDELTLPNEGQPAELSVVRGDGQNGTVGEPLADSLVVQVRDRFGNAVGGVEVNWTAEVGGIVEPGRSR